MTKPTMRLRFAEIKQHVPREDRWRLTGWLQAQPYSDDKTEIWIDVTPVASMFDFGVIDDD